MKLHILMLSAIGFVTADPVPFPEKCKISDAACIKQAATKAIPIVAAGIPQYGMDKLDPAFFTKIDASTKTLKLILTNSTVIGLKDTKAKKILIDVNNNKITLKIICDVILDGHYDMNGNILFLPIEGNGKIHVALNKFQVEYDIETVKQVKDSKTFLKIKDWKYSYDLKAKSNIEFENLFNGNELLGAAVKQLIATSGNEVILEIGPPVIKVVATKILSSIKYLLRNVPVEDLFLQ